MATGILDLPDDLRGLIYQHLNSAASKRAFRHSHSSIYRSPAVNAHLTAVSVDGTIEFFSKIATFPRPATMRRLEVKSCGDLGAVLSEFWSNLMQNYTADSNPLASVQHLCIRDCDLKAGRGSFLVSCLPKLCDGSKGASLQLLNCGLDAMAFSWCMKKLKLECLLLFQCSGMPGDELFQALGHATSLKQLVVQFYSLIPCNVAPLSSLKYLRVLKIFEFIAKGESLQELLADLPALMLLGIEYKALEGRVPLSSHTVKQLWVPMVPVISSQRPDLATQFPLQDFVIGGIDFQFTSLDDLETDEGAHLEQVAHTAQWLLGLPLRPSATFVHTLGPDTFPEVAAFAMHDLNESPPEHAASCLQALSPLSKVLSSVKALIAGWFPFSPTTVSLLGNLFENVERLILYGDPFVPLGECALLCMRRMPRLHELKLDLGGDDSTTQVDDLLAPMMEACMSQRGLELVVVEEQGSENCASLEALARQWGASMQLLMERGPQQQHQPSVKLTVTRVPVNIE